MAAERRSRIGAGKGRRAPARHVDVNLDDLVHRSHVVVTGLVQGVECDDLVVGDVDELGDDQQGISEHRLAAEPVAFLQREVAHRHPSSPDGSAFAQSRRRAFAPAPRARRHERPPAARRRRAGTARVPPASGETAGSAVRSRRHRVPRRRRQRRSSRCAYVRSRQPPAPRCPARRWCRAAPPQPLPPVHAGCVRSATEPDPGGAVAARTVLAPPVACLVAALGAGFRADARAAATVEEEVPCPSTC